MWECTGPTSLGALTSSATFDSFKGREYFRTFWERCYPANDYRKQLSAPIYDLVRHGLAHVFVAKPSIAVYKGGSARFHLCRERRSGALFISAEELATDLKRAYARDVKPHVNDALGVGMQVRLDEMHAADSRLVKKHAHLVELAPIFDLPVHSASPGISHEAMWSSTAPSGAPTIIKTVVNFPAPPVRSR